MSKKPVTSRHENETVDEEASHEGETLAMVRQLAAAKKRWAPNGKQIGIGAAAIGSAAVVAALLYWRGNRK